ncbi:MAG: hypothetical protein LBS86_00685 [Treponema sp.]|jgi:hypothetical protein|nr:hypothetical protein [Treponema sp.]
MKSIALVLIVALAVPAVLFSADKRSIPLDMFIIIDASTALRNVKDAVIEWVCDHLIDNQLQDGDHLTVWLVTDNAQIVFSDSLDRVRKGAVKTTLRKLRPSGGNANFSAALHDAAVRATAIQNANHIVSTFLVVGAESDIFLNKADDAAELLRFSRVQDFSGWRLLTIGLGLAAQVQRGAAGWQ